MIEDLYKVLGVDNKASQDEIKKAYRKKASENHPDRSPENAETMSSINLAYQTLSDPEKRKSYDETGSVEKESREQRIEMVLMELLFKVSDECDNMSEILLKTKELIGQALRKGSEIMDENKRKIRSLERKRKSYVYKGKGLDLFGAKLEGQIVNLQKNNIALDNELELVKEATKLIINYEALDTGEKSIRYPSLLGSLGRHLNPYFGGGFK